MREGPHHVGPFSFCLTTHWNMAREWRRMKYAIKQNGIIQERCIQHPVHDCGFIIKSAVATLSPFGQKQKRPLSLVAFVSL